MQLLTRLGLGAVVMACFAQQEKPGPAFLRPVNESVLKSGAIQVVARVAGPGKLQVDGKAVPTTSPTATALVGDLKLGPGMPELALDSGPKIGVSKIRVFVAGGAEQPPAGWAVFRQHPPAAKCDACHSNTSETWSLESVPTMESCKGCHDLAKFPETHTHAPSVLEECQLCHQPHGSKEAFHLKFPKETACKQCHG